MGNYWLVTVIGPLLPVVVGLISKSKAAAQLKAVLTIAVSFVAGLINQIVEGTAVWSKELAIATVIAYVVTIASYLGVYKNFEANSKLLPNFGFGKPQN